MRAFAWAVLETAYLLAFLLAVLVCSSVLDFLESR